MTILTAPEGYWYTNGEVYSDKVYIGKADSAENWQLVTDEEKQAAEEAAAESEEHDERAALH